MIDNKNIIVAIINFYVNIKVRGGKDIKKGGRVHEKKK